MDRIKLDARISENMKSIFGFALTRLGNVQEAEDLAGDILYALIRSAGNLKDEDRFYGFMWKIAENTYKEYLRKKSKRTPLTAELDENIPDESESAEQTMIRQEELNLLRRELSLLSKQYRDATVLYYIQNLSCSEVAEKLQISTEMVKYYLFRARKIIREGMNMERVYGEKSYRPGIFEIDFWGSKAGEDSAYLDFQKRKIKGNILLAAYYGPVTAQEISMELGVALPYLEDEIQLLMKPQYLVCNNGRYLTNIPIFTQECTEKIDGELRGLTEETAKKFIEAADAFDARFGDRFADENLSRWQKVLLCMHYSIMKTERDFQKNHGELPKGGPYSLINGGGGQGVIWGRSFDCEANNGLPHGIQGLYNGCVSGDKRGSVIAMNFLQTLNAQHFEYGMTDALVGAAVDCGVNLSQDRRALLDRLGYMKNGKSNFPVWTYEEYRELQEILAERIALVTALNRKTSEIAARVTADLAPAHIRSSAEYVGALVYRFNSMDNLASVLFDMGWLKSVDDKEKPAVCVVTN